MLDTLRRFEATALTPSPTVELELTVTANPDALHRIVRVVSMTPYTLLTLRLGAPSGGRRLLRMSVGGDESRFAMLRKRLDRVVDILEVEVVR